MDDGLHMGEMLYFEGIRRCVICGQRLYTQASLWCEWCRDEKMHELLEVLLDHLREFLSTHEPKNPREDPAMAFTADIGKLASKHPYFTSLKKVVTMLIERGVAKRWTSADKIWGPDLLIDAKRLLPLFAQIDLCGYRIVNGHVEVEWSPNSILKRAHFWIQTEPSDNETASFLLGYILLHALKETIEILKKNDKLAPEQGVARLYPIEYSDVGRPKSLRLPKGITAVLSFLLGSWARGWTEFDEFTLHKFLDSRGVTGREFNLATALLSQTLPGISHGILEYETYFPGGIPVKRFRFSEPIIRLRDNLRQRMRDRG